MYINRERPERESWMRRDEAEKKEGTKESAK